MFYSPLVTKTFNQVCCSLRKELEVLFSFCIPKVKVIPKTYMFEYVCLPAVKWQGGDARLTIHYDSGFTLHTVVPSEGPEPSTSTPTTVAWSYPYEKLRMTGDDGHRLLWLEFSDGSEQVYFDEYFFFLNLIKYCSLLKVLFSFTWNKLLRG